MRCSIPSATVRTALRSVDSECSRLSEDPTTEAFALCVLFAHADIADCADEMEATLLADSDLQKHPEQIKQVCVRPLSRVNLCCLIQVCHYGVVARSQGVDRWRDRVQRAADKNFDKFELYTLKHVFAVPENLQLGPPQAIAAEEDAQLDAETEALWLQLQQALATKRELTRTLTAAETTLELWTTHRDSVMQLAASQQSSQVDSTLRGVQQLTNTLQDGWQMLRSSEAGGGRAGTVPGPRGALQRYSQRRAQITTTSPADLLNISSLLTAS